MRIIEFERRRMNMTQRQFGNYVGIDASYICNAERNGVMYNNHKERIAKKLGLPGHGDNLLDEIDTPKEASNA